MKSLLDRDLVKGNILDVIREYRERLEILERLAKESTGGEGSQGVAEGPDIDLVYSGGTAVIGRGGDTILLYDSAGAPVAEYAFTAAGLTAALAAMGSGDRVDIPVGTITATNGFTVPAGGIVRGAGREQTIIDIDFVATLEATQLGFGFDLASGSVLENLTVDVHVTRSGYLSENTNSTGVDLDNSIVRDVTIKINHEAAYGYGFGIYGHNFYGGNVYDPTPTVENVSIYVTVTKALEGTDQTLDVYGVYGMFDPAGSNEQKTCIIRNMDIVANFTMDDSVDQFIRFYGAYIEAYHGRTIIDGCNIRTFADGPKAGFFEGYGFYYTKASAAYLLTENCAVYSEIKNSNGDNELYGYYGGGQLIRNCYINLLADGNEAIMYGVYTDATIQGCEIIAHTSGTGVDIVGAYVYGSILLDSRFSGDTYDIYVFSSDGSVYACQYDSVGDDGSTVLILMTGDRRSLSIPATKTTTYAITRDNEVVLADATGGAFSVTLPAAAGCKGWIETIKKIDASANAVTVDPDASETIENATTYPLSAQYESVQITSDGTEWWII